MSDEPSPPAADLEARVALLETLVARGLAAPAPTAAPPIVIGPFDNVPAPGSPIRSDWPQEITNYVVDLRNGLMFLRSGSTSVTTDPSGLASVTYGITYPFAPYVNVTVESLAAGPYMAMLHSRTTTYFVFWLINTTTGAVYANAGVTVNWSVSSGGLL